MAFTNNKNQDAEYKVNKLMNANKMNYMLSKDFSENKSSTKMFELGSVPKLHSGNMSFNNVDIESKLRGIKSVNLEGSGLNPELQPRKINVAPLFERQKMFVPPSFVHVSERKGFHNI